MSPNNRENNNKEDNTKEKGENQLPAHLRFRRRRQKERKAKKLKNKEKYRKVQRERSRVDRYLFKQWLRLQYRKKHIPSNYFRQYSINHQCYLWMIERAAGILCGDHPESWIYRAKGHEQFFAYLFGSHYSMGGLALPPRTITGLQQALKNEVPWLERQDMRQIIVTILWQKYGNLEQLPWADKAVKKIGYYLKFYLRETMREISVQRYYCQRHNIDDAQDTEWVVARNIDDAINMLMVFSTHLSKAHRYATLQMMLNGLICGDMLKTSYILKPKYYTFTIRKLYGIFEEKRQGRQYRAYSLKNKPFLDDTKGTKG